MGTAWTAALELARRAPPRPRRCVHTPDCVFVGENAWLGKGKIMVKSKQKLTSLFKMVSFGMIVNTVEIHWIFYPDLCVQTKPRLCSDDTQRLRGEGFIFL